MTRLSDPFCNFLMILYGEMSQVIEWNRNDDMNETKWIEMTVMIAFSPSRALFSDLSMPLWHYHWVEQTTFTPFRISLCYLLSSNCAGPVGESTTTPEPHLSFFPYFLISLLFLLFVYSSPLSHHFFHVFSFLFHFSPQTATSCLFFPYLLMNDCYVCTLDDDWTWRETLDEWPWPIHT